MRAIRLFVVTFLFLVPLLARGATLTGVVKAPNGQPVDGATVESGGRTVLTDAQGRFSIDLAAGVRVLRVSRSGFLTADVPAGTSEITLQPALAESIVVSGIRAEATTPVTKSDLSRADIERDYSWQDVPLLLRDTPSINTYTESGIGGSGYSYITLRGISPTRLNFTLDGVPLADSEDMGVYFADFPDLAHSLQSIQVQRGVGTSTVGSPSFGGSVNLESIALSQSPGFNAEAGAGSFGTKFATVGWQSGMTPSGFAMYARLSVDQSDGFRESSGVRQHNLFVSAAKQNDTSRIELMGFSAHERTAQSFLAADADTLKTDLRFNEMSPLELDSFGYDLAQLQYLKALSPATNMTASVYYQRGYGWYRLFDDETTRDTLRQYGLDGLLIGSMLTLSTSHGPIAASYGLNVNEFRREHTRDVVLGADAGTRDYYNYGTKGELNAFAKYTWNVGRAHLYNDDQLRSTNFHYHGDVAIAPIRWTFFNPKVGARYDLTPASGIYASAGLSRREPTRNDLFQGEDNATFAHDLHAVTPERLLDFEAGYDRRAGNATLHANVYAMEFHHEIASTGELSDIGLLLRRNVDRSYRRGIELEATWQATPSLHFRGNANLSESRIRTWTQFFDVYDAAGNFTGSTPIVFHNVKPVLTPQLIINQSVDWTPASRLTLGATGRYVGKSQLDNTNDPSLVAPSFATLEANAAWDLGRGTRVRLQVNNVTDNKRVYPSGYSYNYIAAGVVSGTAYYYPQATRNAVVMIDFKR
jgi:iron complex outermembrane receptor protein